VTKLYKPQLQTFFSGFGPDIVAMAKILLVSLLAAVVSVVAYRDRFYKTPLRPKTFPTISHPQISDKFPI
jgi:hypothetical protein